MSSSTPQGPGGPEHLDSGHGTPLPPERSAGGSGRKRALIAGGAVVGLALVGGAAWAAASFLSTGEQPAGALPASTLAYASVDLDPSGSQKIEAISMLRKFPAFREETGLQARDDLREWAFTELIESGECEGLDYGKDVEPWLGDRVAIAAVDTGDDAPAPVGVVQVTDAEAAEQGMAGVLEACGGDGGGWQIEGDWAILAETAEVADKVADSTDQGTLADDETYQRWTEEAGDPGVITAYAAPGAAQMLVDQLGGLDSMAGAYGGVDPLTGEPGTDPESEAPSLMEEAVADFGGMAATVRFDDGGVELEVAGNPGKQAEGLEEGAGGVEALRSLPGDTVAAVGVDFADGWFDLFAEQVASTPGSGMEDKEDLYTELENQTGLDLPQDAEVLTGESLAVSLGAGFDLESMFNSSGPADIPVGVKVKGDAGAIEGVLAKVRESATQMGGPTAAELLTSESEGDYVALSPSSDYRSELVGEGSLGDSAAFQSVVEDVDEASAVFFVDFDAGDGWLEELAGSDKANLEPLSALGLSAWRDGDTQHSVLRLTTD